MKRPWRNARASLLQPCCNPLFGSAPKSYSDRLVHGGLGRLFGARRVTGQLAPTADPRSSTNRHSSSRPWVNSSLSSAERVYGSVFVGTAHVACEEVDVQVRQLLPWMSTFVLTAPVTSWSAREVRRMSSMSDAASASPRSWSSTAWRLRIP
jgi:hypothetical protein